MKFSGVRKQPLKVFVDRLCVSHNHSKAKLAVLSAVLLLLLLTGFAFLAEGPAWFQVPTTPYSPICKSLTLMFLRDGFECSVLNKSSS